MVQTHSVQFDVFSVEPKTAVRSELYCSAGLTVRNNSAVVKLCFEGVKVRRISIPKAWIFSSYSYFLIWIAFSGQQYLSVFIRNNVFNRIPSDAFGGQLNISDIAVLNVLFF